MPRKRSPANQDTASTYIPEPHIVRIAEERTAAIRRRFMSEAAWKPADFSILAQSCYMQGLHDMADAAAQKGWIPGGVQAMETPAPWEL